MDYLIAVLLLILIGEVEAIRRALSSQESEG
jgi:hypothetical protein